jgi:acetolactate synthase-1/2/3 large subunit
MQHITKWAEPITMGKAVPEVLRRAFFQLRNGRPGPVMLEVPLDVMNEEVPDNWTYVPAFSAKTAPAPDDIAAAANALASAERPVIYAGQGVHYAKAWDELKALAEAWNIPVTTSIEGKSAFPENHPLSLGSGGRANARQVKKYLADADVIFGIGVSFALTAFGVPMPANKDGSKTIIHATLDPMDLNKDVPAQHGLIGDAKLTLQALSSAMETYSKAPAEKRANEPENIAAIKAEWLSEWLPKLTSNDTPINPYRVIAELDRIGRQRQRGHYPRRRQPTRPDHTVLGIYDATVLHRLGQDDSARLWPRLSHGSQASGTRETVHKRLGRCGYRLYRHGL